MPRKKELEPVPGQQTLWSSTPSDGPPVSPVIKGAWSRAEESPRFIQSSLLGAFKKDVPGHIQRSMASDELSPDGGHKKAPDEGGEPITQELSGGPVTEELSGDQDKNQHNRNGKQKRPRAPEELSF